MIELNEKAGIYAEKNVINILKDAIAKVYADGYRDGYRDCQNHESVNLRISNTEYVDLGLPSGTLWSAGYEADDDGHILYVPYKNADKYCIPTVDQWKELLDYCRFDGEYSSSGTQFFGIKCIGANGNSIMFKTQGYMIEEKLVSKNPIYGGGVVYFWAFDKEDGIDKNAIIIEPRTYPASNKNIIKFFSGYKLPIRLVRKK